MKNAIQILADDIRKRLPVLVTIDEPANNGAHWWLTVTFNSNQVEVEWNPEKGFGLCNCPNHGDHPFGGGPDEVSQDPNYVLEFVLRQFWQPKKSL